MDIILRSRRSPTLHDFPYKGGGRKCYHKWIINVTPPGSENCLHGCIYCYARDAVYSRRHDSGMAVYTNLAALVEKELSGLDLCPPVSLSNVTDPCQEIPELRRVVREVVEVLVSWGVNFHIITKGDPSFLSDIDGFPGKGRFFLAVTVEGPPEVLARLSPRAPAYERRLEALRWASYLGLPSLVRLDPVIPPLWRALYGKDWLENAGAVLADCAAAGAGHVVSSTGRFTATTRNSLAHLAHGAAEWEKAIPQGALREVSTDGEAAMEEAYAYDRSYTSSGYMLRHEMRLGFHRRMKDVARDHGMTYAVCQELAAEEADTPGLPHCEAFPMPFSRRSGPREFEPVPGCTANCHASCIGLDKPPCGRPELARAQPYKPSSLKVPGARPRRG